MITMFKGDLVRCKACKGTKRIVGMGMMEKDCIECKGIGWVNPPIKEVETKIIVKRGRPKMKKGSDICPVVEAVKN